MSTLLERKTKLMLETPYAFGGRPLIAHVEPSGLRLRLKGKRHGLEISWAQIHNRAAVIAAERAREERKARRRKRGEE